VKFGQVIVFLDFSHILGRHAKLASNIVGKFNRRSIDIDRREKRRFVIDGIV
jgi:hypothetical protein